MRPQKSINRPYRVAYLVSHPIQYQAPLLKRLANDPELDLTVFFLSDLSLAAYDDEGFGTSVRWDVPLLDGYRHAFLRAFGSRAKVTFWRPFVYGITKALASGKFDALWLHGYTNQAHIRAIFAANRLGIRVLLRGESNNHQRRRESMGALARRVILPWLFGCADAFLAIGSLNRRFYLDHGVAERRIFHMPYTVDNEFFQQRARDAAKRRNETRAELNLQPGRPVILYASKFQRRKRPMDLLEAYAALSEDGRHEPKPYLLFVGDGEQRQALESRAASLGWGSIRFLGFQNQTEMPKFFDLCDMFALPSESEPWGLVINEVMNAAKPVIVTDEVGCAPDLIRDGWNGFVVPVGDTARLKSCLGAISESPALAAEMGARSLARISEWNFEENRSGLLQALHTFARQPSPYDQL